MITGRAQWGSAQYGQRVEPFVVEATATPAIDAPRGLARAGDLGVLLAAAAARSLGRQAEYALVIAAIVTRTVLRIAAASLTITATAQRAITRAADLAVVASTLTARALGRSADLTATITATAQRGIGRVAVPYLAAIARAFLPRDFSARRWLIIPVTVRFFVSENRTMNFPSTYKDPMAVQPQGFDWRTYLSRLNATIATSEWLVPAGLELVASSIEPDLGQTTVILGGGATGRVYQVTNRITTNTGIVQDRTFVVRVEEQ